ncbi:hypothetical protein CLBKND_04898 [Methylorubrum aminovorans]
MAPEANRKTYYVVQSFSRPQGKLQMDFPLEARSEAAAMRTAERLAQHKATVLVLARTGDPSTSEFDEPILLRSFGKMDDEDLPF